MDRLEKGQILQPVYRVCKGSDPFSKRSSDPAYATGATPDRLQTLGWPEISYHSERAWFADTESSSRQIGILYCGGYAKEMTGKEDVFIYVIYNMHWNEHKFALPDIPEGMRWYLAIDSSKKNSVCPKGEELLLEEKKSIYVKPRTILVLLGDAREPGAKA